MESLVSAILTTYLISLGVILGGTLMGSLGSYLTQGPPAYITLELAEQLKIWALVTALGGTFAPLKALEISFLSGQPGDLYKQIVLIFSAFFGAQSGYLLLKHLAGGR